VSLTTADIAPPKLSREAAALTASVNLAPDALTTTVEGGMRMTNLGRTSINKLIKSGEIESVMVLGRRLLIIASIRAMIERNRLKQAA
jgi:hypothetical protein